MLTNMHEGGKNLTKSMYDSGNSICSLGKTKLYQIEECFGGV